MHIPKTGGTTLAEVIKSQYNHNVEFFQGEVLDLKDKIEGSDSLLGHIPFGIHRHFSKPCIYITMMRDPIERVISIYYYIQRQEKHYLHNKVKKLTLDQFITDKDFKHEFVNLQTRYFCEGKTPNLEQAKKNLNDHFTIVGITELFDASLSLIKHELGWKSVQYQKRNVTQNRPLKSDFSAETINKIKQNNMLDIELYEYAKSILIDKLTNI